MNITSVESNRQLLDGGAMFGNAPRAVWEKWVTPDERHRIPLACRCFLLEFDDQKILLETGIGAFFEPKLADRFGVQQPDQHLLLYNLKDMGLEEKDITMVILSHLHFDHAGGLLPPYSDIQKNGSRLLFPNAQYLTSRQNWERAKKPHSRDRASFLPELNKLLEESNRLQLIDEESPETLFNGKIQFRFSNGHTPGQMHTVVNGNERQAIFCGDLVPGQAWIHTAITMGYDRFAELVIDEKNQLYEESVPGQWLHLFTHDPSVSAATVQKNEKQRYLPDKIFETLNAHGI